MKDKIIYVGLTEKELNSIVFQLQERIEHYQLQENKLYRNTKKSTAYLEGIQDKLLECKNKQSKKYYQKKWS